MLLVLSSESDLGLIDNIDHLSKELTSLFEFKSKPTTELELSF